MKAFERHALHSDPATAGNNHLARPTTLLLAIGCFAAAVLLGGCAAGVIGVAAVALSSGGGGGGGPAGLKMANVGSLAWRYGDAQTLTWSATGGQPPYTYQLSAGSLPKGLSWRSVNDTLELSGAPSGDPGEYQTILGMYDITWVAGDAAGQSATSSMTMYVTPRLELQDLSDQLYVAWHWPILDPDAQDGELDGLVLAPSGGYQGPSGEDYDLVLISASGASSTIEGVFLSEDTDKKWRLWGTPIPGGLASWDFSVSVTDAAFALRYPGCPVDRLQEVFPHDSHGQPTAARLDGADPVAILTETLPVVASSGTYEAEIEVRDGTGDYGWSVSGPDGFRVVKEQDRWLLERLSGAEEISSSCLIRLRARDQITGSTGPSSLQLSSEFEWTYKTVDTVGNSAPSAFVITDDGTLWVGYYEPSSNNLIVAHLSRGEPTWIEETLGTFSYGQVSMDLAADGTIWLACRDTIAHLPPGGVWVQEPVESGAFINTGATLTVAGDGAVWLVYATNVLKVAHFQPGGSWVRQQVDTQGTAPSIAVAENGTAWVAYVFQGQLRVAHLPPGGAWVSETIESEDYADIDSGVKVAGDGTVWVGYSSYETNVGRSLIVAHLSPGGTWVKEAVIDQVSWNMSLEAAADGTIWAGSGMRLARLAPGGTWVTQTLESEGEGELGLGALEAAADGTIWATFVDEGAGGGSAELKLAQLPPASSAFKEKLAESADMYSSVGAAGDGTPWVAWVQDMKLVVAHRDASGTWIPQTVDDGKSGTIAYYCSLQVQEDGTVWVSYTGGGNSPSGRDIRLAHLPPGGAWAKQTLETGFTEGGVVESSLGVASDGTVWISFVRDNVLKVGRIPPGGSWSVVDVDSTRDHLSDLAVAGDGTPWVAYDGTTNQDLKVAHPGTGGTWIKESVEANAGLPSVTVAGDGTAWVGYGAQPNLLKVARRGTGGNWTSETLEKLAGWASLDAAPDGTIWVGYMSFLWGTGVKVAYKVPGSSWTKDSVDSGGGIPSLCVTPGGVVWMGYNHQYDPLYVACSFSRPALGIGYHEGFVPGVSHIPARVGRVAGVRAVPVFLRLGRDRCKTVSFSVEWDQAVAQLVSGGVTWDGCPALDSLHGGQGPTSQEFQFQISRGSARIKVDLSRLGPSEWLPPYFEHAICFLYFQAVSTQKGASCDLTLEGYTAGQPPDIVTWSDATLHPATKDGSLAIR